LGTITDIIATPFASSPLRFVIDDGTGKLPVVMFRPQFLNAGLCSSGEEAMVRGTIQVFRDNLQIRADDVRRVSDSNMTTAWTNFVIYSKLK